MLNRYDYQLEFKVRDYECDMEGIVNNSIYLNYLEHARHEFLISIGLDFKKLMKKGITAVVARADLAYKTPLKSGDRFVVKLRIEQSGIKYVFYQDIFRLPDKKICLKGIITTTSIINGKLVLSDEIVEVINRVAEKRLLTLG